VLFTLLAAALSSAPAQTPAAIFPPREAPGASPDSAPDCPSLAPRYADDRRAWIERSRPRTLDELPPARLELAVFRQVDGCPIPAVLRDGIGDARREEGSR
jgi:hypothetical protein